METYRTPAEMVTHSTDIFTTALQLNDSFQKQILRAKNANMKKAVQFTTYFVGTEAVLGFLGNALVIGVFLFRYRSCNFRYFVLCLAFIDILSTLTTVPGEIVTQLNWYDYPDMYLCKAKSFFNVFTVTAEAMCLMTISVDRYRKVCHPHNWQLKPSIAMRLCVVIYCVAFALALPVAFLWGFQESLVSYTYEGQTGKVNATICLKDKHLKDTDGPRAYTIIIYLVCSICFTTMFVLYVYVARRLLKNKIIKRRVTRIQAKPNNSASFGSLTYSQKVEFETAKVSKLPSNGKMTEIEPSLLRSSRWDCDEDMQQTHRSDSGRSSTGSDQEKGTEAETNDNKSIKMSNRNENQDNELCMTEVEVKVGDEKNESTEPTSPVKNGVARPRVKTDINTRVRRKTLIMFILTVIFIITTATYLTLLYLIANDNFEEDLNSDGERAVYLFFFRLVFINHVINPVVYGILDPQFRSIIRKYTSGLTCFRVNQSQ